MKISILFDWFLLLPLIVFFVAPRNVQGFTGTYGINYGRLANNIPSPEKVVVMLKAAKIRNVRIYDADHNVLKAFKGTGFELVVNVPNELVKDMSANGDNAMNWVKENVVAFLPDTPIRGITVGNEILGGSDQELQGALLGAVKNIYNAVGQLHLANLIQISTAHSQVVFVNSFPPSSCVFKESSFQYMKPLLQFFSHIGSPFYINVYPFLAYLSDPDNINLNYTLFEPNLGIHDANTKLYYDNMFEAQIDAAYAALDAAGFGKMAVIVSETGWASRGDENEAVATAQNARTYNYNLRKRLALHKGTPLRPKIPVRAYIFALFNENLKPGPTSERNFGLFKPDGSISYNVGFPALKSSASTSSLSSKNIEAPSFSLCYFIVLATSSAALILVLAS